MNEIKWAFAGFAIQAIVVLSLIYRVYTEYHATGAIQIGTLYMLYGYVGNVGNVFFTFALLYDNIIRTNARIIGAYPIDDAYATLQETDTVMLPPHWRDISLRNVSFTYHQNGTRKHIDTINFTFKRHQKIALVGESGSGKSTLLSLLRGLYGVEKGELYCDGHRLTHGVPVLKEATMLLPQEPEIFNNTVRYNITMDLPYAPVALQRVITMAQLESVIEKLPKRLDSLVMEKGVSLSGGEKQRIALARGLLAAQKSEIVLLDEPTSSIDSITETKIYQHIFEQFNDKTIICAIHRLHLLDAFDDIYLLTDGKIVGHGTLDELKQHPHYKQMWHHYTRQLHDKQHGTGG